MLGFNIFEGETIYGGWRATESVKLSEATSKEMFDSFDDQAEVTESPQGYGKSVCFFINNGQNRIYKKLSTNSKLNVGDKISKNACFVTVLKKQGEQDIYRISETKEV